MSVLAHNGGWDEILMVAGPLLVFAGVLYLANRRANARLAQSAVANASAGTATDENGNEIEASDGGS